MLVEVRGIKREVTSEKVSKNTWKFRVGNATASWTRGNEVPFVYIKDKSYAEFKSSIPLIMEFIREYKRLLTAAQVAPKLSFEGEGKTDTPYKYQPAVSSVGQVSSVPPWIRDIKIKQVCSGPVKGTYERGIRIPQELKDQVVYYMAYCSRCNNRNNCEGPCLCPAITIEEDLPLEAL